MTDARSADLSADQRNELIRQLRQTDETLPERLRNDLLAVGSSIVPALIQIVDTNLEDPDMDAWAAIYATQLLGELRDVRAIPVLLDCLEESEMWEGLNEDARHALKRFGDVVIEPCIERYRSVQNEELRDGVAGILQRVGRKEERIYEILLETLHRTPELGAIYLAEYGDSRALPSLLAKFDELPPIETDNPFANQVFIELEAAIKDLGGHLNKAQLEKLERSDKPRQRFAEKMGAVFPQISSPAATSGPVANEPVRKKHKLGRNDPCWCGSGKKYKRCHLPLER